MPALGIKGMDSCHWMLCWTKWHATSLTSLSEPVLDWVYEVRHLYAQLINLQALTPKHSPEKHDRMTSKTNKQVIAILVKAMKKLKWKPEKAKRFFLKNNLHALIEENHVVWFCSFRFHLNVKKEQVYFSALTWAKPQIDSRTHNTELQTRIVMSAGVVQVVLHSHSDYGVPRVFSHISFSHCRVQEQSAEALSNIPQDPLLNRVWKQWFLGKTAFLSLMCHI